MKKCLIRDSDIVFIYAISPDISEFFNKQESDVYKRQPVSGKEASELNGYDRVKLFTGIRSMLIHGVFK